MILVNKVPQSHTRREILVEVCVSGIRPVVRSMKTVRFRGAGRQDWIGREVTGIGGERSQLLGEKSWALATATLWQDIVM